MKAVDATIYFPNGSTQTYSNVISYGTNSSGHLVMDTKEDGRIVTNLPYLIHVK